MPEVSKGGFRHILMPTDGSDLSARSIDAGMRFARQVGARVTGFHAVAKRDVFAGAAELIEMTDAEYDEAALPLARHILDALKRVGEAHGVRCDVAWVVHDHPCEAIVAAADARACDLIVMATHGRRGLDGMLHGSETQKVLTHCKLPVLVIRE